MRILLIYYYTMDDKNATGTTLRNFFSGMPDVELLQYTMNPSAEIKQENICGTPLYTVRNAKSNALVKFIYRVHNDTTGSKITGTVQKSRKGLRGSLVQKLKKSLLLWNELIPNPPDESVQRAVEAFRPEVIYTLGGDINVLKNAIFFSDKYGVPIVVHNMDDLFSTKFAAPTLLNKIARRKIQKLYREAYARSKQSLAIGPLMAEEYAKEFNLPFDWAMNCVGDVGDMSDVAEEKGLMIFSGGMHGGRAETLRNVAKALETQNDGYRLEIFASGSDIQRYGEWFADMKHTKLLPYVPKAEQFRNLSRAQILVHVESFDPEHIRYFRLSMSTKLPEYLVTKRPIFCLGPMKISTTEFIRNAGIGVVTENEKDIPAIISELLCDEKKAQILCHIEQVLQEKFMRSDVQQKLLAVFKFNIDERA